MILLLSICFLILGSYKLLFLSKSSILYMNYKNSIEIVVRQQSKDRHWSRYWSRKNHTFWNKGSMELQSCICNSITPFAHIPSSPSKWQAQCVLPKYYCYGPHITLKSFFWSLNRILSFLYLHFPLRILSCLYSHCI